VSHAQFWVFPLPRRNSKDALSEHPPDEGDLVGALAGLKVSPLQNPQPDWQFEPIVDAVTPSAAKQYLSRRVDMTSEFFVNHAQFCIFPDLRSKVYEVSSSAHTVGALVGAVVAVTVGEVDLVGAEVTTGVGIALGAMDLVGASVPATGALVGALVGAFVGALVGALVGVGAIASRAMVRGM
jgi:hypothetical protein